MTIDLLSQIHAAGLPEPELERRVCPERRWRWDVCWSDAKIAVEQMGGVWNAGRHTRGRGYMNDCEKAAEGQLQGYIVLWVTTDMVRDGRALSLIRRAFALRSAENREASAP